MFEMKITIEAPALVAALEKVSNAVKLAHTTQALMEGSPTQAVHTAMEPPAPIPSRPMSQTAPVSAPSDAAPSPVAAPTTAAPVMSPGTSPAPTAGPTYAAPGSASAPTTAPSYTVEQLQKAGGDLITADPSKMPQLMGLLQQFSVPAVTELNPEQYGAFATALRGIGAVI